MTTQLPTETLPLARDDAPTAEESQGTRRIRSFVRRAGRITLAQERALQHEWPRYGIELADNTPDVRPLDLAAIFGRPAPKVLEIGFGNGDTLRHVAASQRDRDFLGIEVHRAGVGRLLHEAARDGLDNLKVICHDAVEVLERHLTENSLDEVWILFPDPWHKARHHKRRLIQDPFVNLLASRMKMGGLLHLATDWQAYADQMREVMAANSHFTPLSDNASRPTWRPLTRFERRGQRLGHQVWDFSFKKIG